MAIYAPILASSQPAFERPSQGYNIEFKLSTYTNFADVGCVSIRIVNQKNNQTVVNTSTYPDGIIYKNTPLIGRNEYGYYIQIANSDLLNGWMPNQYYKVQMRLCKQPYVSGTGFAEWKAKQTRGQDGGGFSEWSTVMVLKCINRPTVTVVNNAKTLASSLLITDFSESTLNTVTPIFYGQFTCEGELEDKYRFALYRGSTELDLVPENLVEDSGWLQHDSNVAEFCTDSHMFKTALTTHQKYIVTYGVITYNLFQIETSFDKTVEQQPFVFKVEETHLNRPEGITLEVDDNSHFALENGCIDIYISSEEPLTGNFVLSRACELDNDQFAYWEDIHYKVFSVEPCNHSLFFRDLWAESGIKYKYRIQYENVNGLRSNPVYERGTLDVSPARQINYEYSFLVRGNKQLKVKFNDSISSFKKTVLEAKADTLGSRYPTISRNGLAYYAEFPLKGLISLHADDFGCLFLDKRADGYYWNDELIISEDKFDWDKAVSSFNWDLTDDNRFIERKYRDCVESFLNDGTYKLFKSGTEGNFVVTLMNVSLTPNKTLGRMLCEFSATAYEVADKDLDSLKSLGILPVDGFKNSENAFADKKIIGQLAGLYRGVYRIDYVNGNPVPRANAVVDNLLDLIAEENSYNIGEGYSYKFKKLDSFSLEAYPKRDFTQELNELEARRIMAELEGEDVAALVQEIARISALRDAVDAMPKNTNVAAEVNGVNVILAFGRQYTMKDFGPITSLRLKYDAPIVLNYICTVEAVIDKTKSVQAIVSSSLWDQLVGIFTSTPEIISNYNYEGIIPPLKYSEGTKFDLYQTLNLLDTIKENALNQVQKAYGVTFNHYDEAIDCWDNGKIFYQFSDITSLEIEADAGTALILTSYEDKVSRVVIGPSERYSLKNAFSKIKGLAFEKPTFAVVNFRCSTLQREMGE